ncbi:metal ABC transporter permease [Cryptosporangium sp. NPDC048952]|uniref:metal ABC transporter permease n=1 Tax=Cryptosporangium sp. NPDC048952 TaxID=3363961 RepID=UPI0037198B32
MSILHYDFMVRALIAAVLVGLTAPAVGIYLVQRRMSLVGDGIGHIALTGVALGFLTGQSPVISAVVVAALGAVAVELIRSRGGASGDVALSLLFYGGIAGGVLLISLAPSGGNANLLGYLFGSLLTTAPSDLIVMGILTVAVLAFTVGLRSWLFAICHDEEFARVSGVPVRLLNILLAVSAAVTVTVAMRVVGVLLVSALMVIPVATAQQVARGFVATMAGAMGLSVAVALTGAVGSFYLDVPSGASIVVLAVLVFVVVTAAAAGVRAWQRRNATPRPSVSPTPPAADPDPAVPAEAGAPTR